MVRSIGFILVFAMTLFSNAAIGDAFHTEDHARNSSWVNPEKPLHLRNTKPHVQTGASVVKPDTTLAAFYFSKAGQFSEEAEYDSAIVYFEMAATQYKNNEAWPRYVECYTQMGRNALQKNPQPGTFNRTRYGGDVLDQAAKYFNQALITAMARLGEGHSTLAAAYSNLGIVYHSQDHYNRALEFHNKALAIRLAKLGDEHLDTADSYYHLGNAHRRLAEYDRALEFHNKALAIRLARFGEQHLEVANSYHSLGEVQERKGDYDAALDSHNKALSVRLTNLRDLHPDVGLSYTSIGNDYRGKGNYDRALEFLNKGLAIRKATLGEQHLDVANSYHYLGEAHDFRSDYDRALEFHNKALEVRLSNLGTQHPDVAHSYNQIGNAYLSKGVYDRALEFHNKALAIRLSALGEQHLGVAASYNNLANVFFLSGNYDRALELYRKSLSIKLAIFDEPNHYIAVGYNNIGATYENKGDYDRALEFYNKALSIRQDQLGEHHPDLVSAYLNLGDVYHSKGDYDHAFDYFSRALSISRSTLGEKHELVGANYGKLGVVYHNKGDHDRAIEFYEKALSIHLAALGDQHPRVALDYNYIGNAYTQKGDYVLAREFNSKALAIRLATLGDKHPDVAASYLNMGFAYWRMIDYDRAIEFCNKAASIYGKTFAGKHPSLAKTLNYLGGIYRDQGDYDSALELYQRAIIANGAAARDLDRYGNPPLRVVLDETELIQSLSGKAHTLVRRYDNPTGKLSDLDAALAAYQLADELIDQMRSSYKARGSKLFLAEEFNTLYDRAIQATLKLYETTKDSQYRQQAFHFAEKGKSMVLWEGLAESQARQFAGIPDSLLEEERQLRIDLAFYDTQLQREFLKENQGDSTRARAYEASLFKLKTKYDGLIEDFEERFPKYYELKHQNKAATIAEIQHRLAANAVLIDYFVGDSTIQVFAITKDLFRVNTQTKDTTFAQLVDDFYQSIRKADTRSYMETAPQLYNLLIRPVAEIIDSKDRLVIIPHDLLHKIPYEALLAKSPSYPPSGQKKERIDYRSLDYLIKHFDISYHYSATLFANSPGGTTNSMSARQAGPEQYNFIGFAPVFPEDDNTGYTLASNDLAFLSGDQDEAFRSVTIDGKKFSELRHSENEVKSIVELFARKAEEVRSIGYFYDNATEDMFKKSAGNYRHVHIATHSFVNQESPQLSGVVFAQPMGADSTEDGVLYAGETYNLELNADLLVLSSCESGLGKLIRGEGMIAMTRGFLYAGASNLMFSLWKVSDKNTSELMVEFYKQLLSDKTYAAALRQAKLKLIGNRSSARPWSWSSFVLLGGD